MVGVQEGKGSKVFGLYGMLDYHALSVTNESHAFILTSRLNGWCPRFFFFSVVVVLVLFFIYLTILPLKLLFELGKLIKCPPRFRKALLPIWLLRLVEI